MLSFIRNFCFLRHGLHPSIILVLLQALTQLPFLKIIQVSNIILLFLDLHHFYTKGYPIPHSFLTDHYCYSHQYIPSHKVSIHAHFLATHIKYCFHWNPLSNSHYPDMNLDAPLYYFLIYRATTDWRNPLNFQC